MKNVSTEYKNILDNSFALSAKSKIVVDNVEYLGDVIKTTPKISHSNSKMIGGFPTKKCSLEIYDINDNLDLENKEISVYRGLIINNSVEWVKQGIFIPRAKDITNDITTKTITLSDMQDKTQLFEEKYISELNWENNAKHTGLEIIQEICTKLNITLSNSNFSWANYSFKQPNFDENVTYREVVSRMAEIGGEIAFLNSDGNLQISSQNITGDSIYNHRYSKLSKEKPFTINTVSLGKEGIDDDIIYPEVIQESRVTWRIEDNPFVDLYREEMIETVGEYIIGKSYVPFELNDFIDGLIYDFNDVREGVDKNNNAFNAVILDYNANGRIKSIIKAETADSNNINYNLAGSNQKSINEVKLEVDHIENEIRSNVSTVEIIENTIGEMSIEIDNNYQEIIDKFDGYVPESKMLEIENSVETLQTNTYTKTEINTKLTDGSVTKVMTTSGTFDEDGMHYEKTNAPTSTTINEMGVSVDASDSGEELLFAGFDQNINETIVRTENLTVRKYLVIGNSRIENYESGGGMFVL